MVEQVKSAVQVQVRRSQERVVPGRFYRSPRQVLDPMSSCESTGFYSSYRDELLTELTLLLVVSILP